MGHQAGREGCDFNVFQQPAEILREALSQDSGSIDRIEIKFPSGYVRAELPKSRSKPRKAAIHLAHLLNAIQFEQ